MKKNPLVTNEISMAGTDWHLVLTLKKPAEVSPVHKCWFLRWCQTWWCWDTNNILTAAGPVAAYLSVVIVFLILCALVLAIFQPYSPCGGDVIPWTNVFTCIKTCVWFSTNACGECVTGCPAKIHFN